MGLIGDQLETQIQRLMKLGEQRSSSETDSPFTTRILPTVAVPEVAQNRGWTEEQQQEYAHRARRLWELQDNAGLPKSELYRRFSWETWRGVRRPDLLAWPSIEGGADGDIPPWAVVAFGPPGTGKTHIATAIFNDLLCRGWSGRWYEVAEALEDVKDEMGDEENDGRTMGKLKESQVLLLDDLGAERQSDFALERISLVLRYRYSRQKPTIITTNHPSLNALDEIDRRLSSRLGGREALQINFAGRQDQRL